MIRGAYHITVDQIVLFIIPDVGETSNALLAEVLRQFTGPKRAKIDVEYRSFEEDLVTLTSTILPIAAAGTIIYSQLKESTSW